jgi:anti-sigma-K factor RskA
VAGTDRDEIDALAGDYVLGTLDVEERRAAEARLASSAAFRAAVAAWESRLQPLADGALPVEPPDGLFEGILARLDGAGMPVADNVADLRCALGRWRWTTAVIGAAAAALAGFILLDLATPPTVPDAYVAVLTSEGAAPKFLATVDVGKGTLSIRPVGGAPAPSGKSYELWEIAPGAAPRSLGLVGQASLSQSLAASPRDLTLAISLEPQGGSTTGAPTGPVVFSGTLVPTE